uniref:PDZ domain-containing protein n=1 Tax=Panagrolaimus sp. JU765 TaxID=591449 RepID=A0AC34Q0I2_9BILA
MRGDVIIAIDGQVVVDLSHSELVALIKTKTRMRLIVLFEDMKKLTEKLEELARIEEEEKLLLKSMNSPNNDENCIQESTISDDVSSGFEDSSEIASNGSLKSSESWSFDESSVQCC